MSQVEEEIEKECWGSHTRLLMGVIVFSFIAFVFYFALMISTY